jgi:LysR family nitrogen assimilation transcriptional regulator
MGRDDPIDLRRLRYFRAVAQLGSLAAAARELHVAQPALTLHVAKLEAALGVKLFTRSSRGMQPTEAGQTLLDHVDRIFAGIEAAKHAVRSSVRKAPKRIPVVIALMPSLADAIVPPLLAALDRVGLEPLIREVPVGDCHRMVDTGEVDCAATVHLDRWTSGEPLFEEPLYLVSQGDRAMGTTVPFTTAVESGVILPIGANFLRQLVDTVATRIGVQPKVLAHVDGLGPRKSAVMAGMGNTILGWINVAQEVQDGILSAQRIVDPDFNRLIVFRARAGLGPEVRETTKHILRELLERKSRQPRDR